MKYGLSQWCWVVSVMILLASSAYAQESKVAAGTAEPHSTQGVAHHANEKAKAGAAKSTAKVKMVDLNNAKKEELKTLPGISAEMADKIVAGRPYGSKADLVSRGILLGGPYQSIRKQVFVGGVKKPSPVGSQRK